MLGIPVAKLVGIALTAGTLGVSSVLGAGTASALGSADEHFIADIAHQGIGYDSLQAAITNGHQVCSSLDRGWSIGELGHDILGNTNLTMRQAAAFVVVSVDSYCPEHTNLFA